MDCEDHAEKLRAYHDDRTNTPGHRRTEHLRHQIDQVRVTRELVQRFRLYVINKNITDSVISYRTEIEKKNNIIMI